MARHSADGGRTSGSALKDRAKLRIAPEIPSLSQYGGVESGVADSASDQLPSGLSIGGGGSSLLGMRAIRGTPLISGFEASSIANSRGFGIYNGLPTGAGNTLGGMSGISSGGIPSLPSGIGSGYPGGSPTGGINAPGGSYGLGSPTGGGGSFFGAGGGGTGHGTPGSGS
jgi:hypothetical protein